jgi:hypothetical protein
MKFTVVRLSRARQHRDGRVPAHLRTDGVFDDAGIEWVGTTKPS